MNIYISSALVGLIGLALSMLMIIRSLKNKAKISNVIFDWKLVFTSDLIIQAIGSLLTIGLGLLLLDSFTDQYPAIVEQKGFYVQVVFATIGYIGSDIASRLFSVVNNRINGAIDYKTTQADQANGTLGAPTPAVKIDKT